MLFRSIWHPVLPAFPSDAVHIKAEVLILVYGGIAWVYEEGCNLSGKRVRGCFLLSLEEYQSAQGYKVNLIQDNNGDEKLNEGVVSEKIAVFVSDGIRYTLKGRVSVDTMKTIVDTMK